MVASGCDFTLCSADAPEGKRTACYDVELEIVSFVENFLCICSLATFSNYFYAAG